MKYIRIVDLLKSKEFEKLIIVKGWVRTKRENKNIIFISLNDGSTLKNIQIVIDIAKFSHDILKNITTGSSISVIGKLVESDGYKQKVEIQADKIEIYGSADPNTYPLQKKGHSLEFLREISHLRFRTNTFGAILRIRHSISYAIHKYFNDHGFFYIHTPIITGSDAEGAGEMFRVTTFDEKNIPLMKNGDVDYSQDFFGKKTKLTVSGQLEAELAAMSLSQVYTFGPTFRAENSNTHRHLAEFWMIEPEMAFYDINDNMDLAEDFLKFLIKYIIDNCYDDIQFLNDMYDKELINRLQNVFSENFQRLTYTNAINILKSSNQKWEFPIEWGDDLKSEHECYLVDHFGKPVILTEYPKNIKAFYMRINDDGKTVRAMDILFPKIGEIIGGSQREERLELLIERIKELNISEKELWWYIDTRKFGTVPHSGFGLGLERLMLFVTGMSNIRDVIPFPRTPKNAEF